MVTAGPTDTLAGTPCRPSDGPSAQRAGRVKAAAAHRAVARSASLDVARTIGDPGPTEHSCSPVAPRPADGLLCGRRAGTQPRARERVLMPGTVGLKPDIPTRFLRELSGCSCVEQLFPLSDFIMKKLPNVKF